MLVRNIIAAFALTGLATAMPTEEFEELEARAGCTRPAFCCKTVLDPVNIFFVTAIGSGCDPKGSGNCPRGKSPLCCPNGQIKVSFCDHQKSWYLLERK